MKPCMYQIKSGRYAGMWHVRNYIGCWGNGRPKYIHIGRYATEKKARRAMEQIW